MEDDHKTKKDFENFLSCTGLMRRSGAAKAIEHYEKFLTLWKDAGPGIAEVEDAQKKLAGLKDE
jgi:hypothetical protein